MTAVILAAGYSTRLYPVTEYFPKALLPIGKKSVMGYLLDDLFAQKNIKHTHIITNDRYMNIMQMSLAAMYPESSYTLVSDGSSTPENRIGAIGDILFAIQKFRINDDLLVLSSDTYTSLRLKEFISFFKSKNGLVNALFDTHNKAVIKNRLGCVEIEGDRMVSFTEKPENPVTTITSIPYYVLSQRILPLVQTYIRDGNPPDAPGQIIAWLLKRTDVFGYLLDNQGYYYDVGTIETYNMLAGKGHVR